MRNTRVLKWAVRAVKDYIYQYGWKSIDKYHQRCAEIGLEAIATMGKPHAVMLTFWPGEEYKGKAPTEIRKELERKFSQHHCKNSRHKVKVQWVRENRKPTPGINGQPGIPGGWHFHAFVVVDLSKVTVEYLKRVLHEMQRDGYFHSYHLSRVGGRHDRTGPVKLHDLIDPQGWAGYLKHAEYLAKEYTKEKDEDHRNTGGSQVTRMPEWLQALMPGDVLDFA